MFGNGLRPQIWDEFVRRFGIAKVGEFYGSTEGNSNILNLDNKSRACGFFPVYGQLLHSVYPIALMRVDENTFEVLRDDSGLCIPCKPGESGEMVEKIVKGNPAKEFHGYANKAETEKKIIHDVYSKGDKIMLQFRGYPLHGQTGLSLLQGQNRGHLQMEGRERVYG